MNEKSLAILATEVSVSPALIVKMTRPEMGSVLSDTSNESDTKSLVVVSESSGLPSESQCIPRQSSVSLFLVVMQIESSVNVSGFID